MATKDSDSVFWYMYGLPCEIGRLFLTIFFYIVRNSVYGIIGFPRKQIQGQTVVITGAGQGLGRQLAFRFAEQQAKLALLDLNLDNVQEVCKEVQSLYPDVIAKPYQIDISDSSQVHHVFNRVRSDFDGQIDILVNNAAITFTKALMNNTEANIRRIFDVNTLANFWTIREVLPEMQERNAGHILTVASIAGFMGTPNMVDYCSTKFAVVGLMDALRGELDAQGYSQIRLTTVCPAMMATNMFRNMSTRFPRVFRITTPESVANDAVTALLEDRELIFSPKSIYSGFYIPRMLLPFETRKHIFGFIQCTVGEHDHED